jgi:addiction module HigA family antidote
MLKVSRLTYLKYERSRRITPNIALRIEAVFGGKADFWLRLQRTYDLEEERRNLLLSSCSFGKVSLCINGL